MKTILKMTALNLVYTCLLRFGSRYAVLVFIILLQTKASGQMIDTASSSIEERLVQLALNSPEIDNALHLSKVNEYQLKAAQNTWMNLLSVSLNYNDQTFAKQTVPTAYVYPKYFFGLTVPLGTLLSKTGVKSAKENIEIGKNNVELLRRQIRENVLSAYKEYVALTQLIAIQSELLNDVNTHLIQTEEKFRNATISLDVYNAAQKNHKQEQAALINLKLQQELKKLELEKMINTKLETVLNK